jgi:uncharacterized protein with PIN domain
MADKCPHCGGEIQLAVPGSKIIDYKPNAATADVPDLRICPHCRKGLYIQFPFVKA